VWVADQHAHLVWRVELDGSGRVVTELADMPSGLGFLPDGSLLVAEMRTQRLWRVPPDGERVLHADLSPLRPGWINDMVVDVHGRAYVGHNRGKYAEAPDLDDDLVLVEPDGAHRVVASGLRGPNGCVVTPDGGTLILADARNERLLAFDIAPDGSLSGRRVWAAGVPVDGICLDAEGAVWTGTATLNEFRRLREGGEILETISVDHWAIAPWLGGLDGRTLFMLVTEASFELFGRLADPGHDHTSTARGRIETLEVSVPGAS
jgi:sugar lactone lactonase YvrE